MKYNNSLSAILLAAYINASEMQDKNSKITSKFGLASYCTVRVYTKGFWYPWTVTSLGMTTGCNGFIGIGAFYEWMFYDYPLTFTCQVLMDWRNMSLKLSMAKRVPIELKVSTEIWGFVVGAAVTTSVQRDLMVSLLVDFKLNDSVNLELQPNIYGVCSYCEDSSFNENEVKAALKDWEKVANSFSEWVANLKDLDKNEDIDEYVSYVTECAKGRISILKKMLEEGRYDVSHDVTPSMLAIGSSGVGKNHITFELLNRFVKENKLSNIAMMSVDGTGITPVGYHGQDFDKVLVNGLDDLYEKGFSYVSALLAVVQLDEMDSFRDNGNRSFSGGSVEKEALKFFAGEKIWNTKYGNLFSKFMMRSGVGAYQSEQNKLRQLTQESVYDDYSRFLTIGMDYTRDLIPNALDHGEIFEDINMVLLNIGQIFDYYLKTDIKYLNRNNTLEKFVLSESLKNLYSKYSSDNVLLAELIKLDKLIKQLASRLDLDKLHFRSAAFIKSLQGLGSVICGMDADVSVEHILDLFDYSVMVQQKSNVAQLFQFAGLGEEAVRRARLHLFVQPLNKAEAYEYLIRNMRELGIQGEVEQYCKQELRKYTTEATRNQYKYHDLRKIIDRLKVFKKQYSSLQVIRSNSGNYSVVSGSYTPTTRQSGARSEISSSELNNVILSNLQSAKILSVEALESAICKLKSFTYVNLDNNEKAKYDKIKESLKQKIVEFKNVFGNRALLQGLFNDSEIDDLLGPEKKSDDDVGTTNG